MSITEDKKRLRQGLRPRILATTPEEREMARHGILKRLGGEARLAAGALILGSVAHRGEADALLFMKHWLESGRALCLPRVADDGTTLEVFRVTSFDLLVPGFRNILEPNPETAEPVAVEKIDVALIPGIAFDRAGNRLGQGGGHYDRFLARLRNDCRRVALAHNWQILDLVRNAPPLGAIPAESHDQGVHEICTPSQIITCAAKEDES